MSQRKLVFHKRSEDGSAKADAVPTDAPTDAPATDAPTDAPGTDAPTDAPATDAPTDGGGDMKTVSVICR